MHPFTSQNNRKKIYRSIQYRSVSSDIKSNKILASQQILPISQMNKYYSIKNDLKKHSKKVLPFYQNNKSLNKSVDYTPSFNLINQKESFKKHTKHQSTSFVKIQNPQNQFTNTLRNSNYLETFQQLMEIQTSPNYSHRKVGPISQKIKAWKDKNRINRIILPSIIQYQNSAFTALDPINLPIDNIQESITRLKKQIQPLPQEYQKLRHQLKYLQKTQQSQYEQFKINFHDQIKKFYLKLSQNSVHHQNHLLISKRQINQLSEFLPEYKKQFNQEHQRQLNLQKIIFQTSPFQLQYQNQNYPHQASLIQNQKTFSSQYIEKEHQINSHKQSINTNIYINRQLYF